MNEYLIKQYGLQQGALEIQYIEEFFGEFPRKKTAAEIVKRLSGRSHLILLANAPLPDDPGSVVPVSFKVAHEIKADESSDAKLADLVTRLDNHVIFDGRRVLYTWIGGTRRDWRGHMTRRCRCPGGRPLRAARSVHAAPQRRSKLHRPRQRARRARPAGSAAPSAAGSP